MKSNKVRIWEIRPNYSTKNGKKTVRSYTVRWIVAGKECSETFQRKAQAERYRSSLITAAKHEEFDVETGLPDSMRPKEEEPPGMTWYELTCRYVAAKWPGQPAKSRSSMVDALATLTPVLVRDDAGKPDLALLRKALIQRAYNPPAAANEVTEDLAAALRWLEERSLPVADLASAGVVRRGLNGLTLTMDGKKAAATTIARKRAVFHNALKFAVHEEKLLDANPLSDVDWSAPDVVTRVDPRTVPNPAQARQLLAAVSYVGRFNGRGRRFLALFGCMYYAALDRARRSACCGQIAYCPNRAGGSSSSATTVRRQRRGIPTAVRPTIGRASSIAETVRYGRSRYLLRSSSSCAGTLMSSELPPMGESSLPRQVA